MAVSYNYAGPRIADDGLVLYLDAANPNSYNLSTPLTWRDISGNRNNGTLVNGTAVVSTTAGNVMSFDGVNDYVSGFSNISIDISKPFSFGLWFYINSYLDSYPAFIQLKTNTTYGWNFGTHNSTTDSYAGVVFGSTSDWNRLKTNNPPSIKNWHNIFITYDGNQASQNYNVYFNLSAQPLFSAGNFNSTTQNNYIGTTNAGTRGIDDYNGYISNIFLYNRELSQAEITQNYNATKGRFGL